MDFKDERIAYFELSDRDNNNSVVVVGIVVGEAYKTAEGMPAIKVRSTLDKEKQDLICRQLKLDRNHVSFWDNGEAAERILAHYKK
ncbi:MAG: hypothetical protein AABX13_03580 [Nanoarchaeota archaeon]